MKLSIYSITKTLFEGQVISATLPTSLGEMTVLDPHLPLVSSLSSGEVRFVRLDGSPDSVAISGGILEIRPESEVVVLVQ